MKKAGVKVLVLSVVLAICLGGLSACPNRDNWYDFYFSVDGGNGSISAEYGLTSPIEAFGGDNYAIEFTATPDEGYQVKEWTLNGNAVEGNKTNTFTAKVTYKQTVNYITVEFEPIPKN